MFKTIALVAALLLPTHAAAVSCGPEQSVKSAYSAADNVFSAHVEGLYVAPGFGRDEFQLARLRVLRVLKGNLAVGSVVAATAEDSVSFVSDGFVPVPESDVLVYTGSTAPFALSSCSRTAPLESASDVPMLERLSESAYAG